MSKGYNTRVYFSDQSDPRLLDILKRVSYDEIELNNRVVTDYVKELSTTNPIFGFSLHGHRADIHEILTQEGNFDVTIDAIKKARKLNLPNLRVFSVLHSRNYMYMQEMCELLQKYDFSHLQFTKLNYAGGAQELPDDLYMDQDAFVHVVKTYEKLKAKYSGTMELSLSKMYGPTHSRLKVHFLGLITPFMKRQRRACHGGIEKIIVDAKTKKIFPCVWTTGEEWINLGYYDEEKGLVFEKKTWFEDIESKIGEPCKSCKILRYCGGYCRSAAIAETNRLTGKIDLYAGFPRCPVSLKITKFVKSHEVKSFFARLFFLKKPYILSSYE